MYNPLQVSLENIIPLTEARDHFSQIINEVQKDKLYVLTKGGKPAVAIVDVKYLEQITGGNANPDHVEAEIQKNPAKVGRPEMLKHETPTIPPPPKPLQTPVSMTPPPPPAPKPFTPPPVPKIEPKAAPKPELITPKIPTTPTPPTPPTPPAAPVATIETSFSSPSTVAATPAAPPPPAKPVGTLDNQTMSNQDDQEKAAAHSRIDPDDGNGPAQYGANTTNTEPDDMSID